MTWAAIIKLALQLLNLIGSSIQSATDSGVGRKEAIAEALTAAATDLAAANAARVAAELKHAADSTDNAFDDEFRRKE